MIHWYKKVVFENYTNFSGRARRSEYWYFSACNIIILIGLSFLPIVTKIQELSWSGLIYNLLILLPSIAVGVRRVHDVGKSGWYILIPIYNLILMCTNGDVGTNEYGPDPKNELNEIDEIGTSPE